MFILIKKDCILNVWKKKSAKIQKRIELLLVYFFFRNIDNYFFYNILIELKNGYFNVLYIDKLNRFSWDSFSTIVWSLKNNIPVKTIELKNARNPEFLSHENNVFFGHLNRKTDCIKEYINWQLVLSEKKRYWDY